MLKSSHCAIRSTPSSHPPSHRPCTAPTLTAPAPPLTDQKSPSLSANTSTICRRNSAKGLGSARNGPIFLASRSRKVSFSLAPTTASTFGRCEGSCSRENRLSKGVGDAVASSASWSTFLQRGDLKCSTGSLQTARSRGKMTTTGH